MDEELARLVALTAFRSSVQLVELLTPLKEHCSASEYDELKFAIAAAAAEIGLQVTQKMFALYPNIEKEFDARVEKYGRVF